MMPKYQTLLILVCLCTATLLTFGQSSGTPLANDDTNSRKKSNKINSITFHGLDSTNKNVVQRELLNKPGGDYTPGNWNKEHDSFESLGIFSQSSLAVKQGPEGLDLDYSFKELPTYIPFPSVKITDQNGTMAGPAFAVMNLLGEAIQMELYYRITLVPEFYRAQEYLLYLASRWIKNIPIEYEIFAVYYNLYNPLKLYNERSMTLSIDSAYRFNKFKIAFSGEIFRVLHDYNNEVFEAGGSEYPQFLSSGPSEYVPKVGLGLVIDNRDRLIDTRNGTYTETRVSQYGGFLGGPAHYTEYLLDFRAFKTFFNRHIAHVSLLAQYRPGSMGAYDFFHVGGPNSLRGYEQSPEHYGQHECLTTIEYRYELLKRKQFRIFNMNLFLGLHLIAGIDTATLWQKNDSYNTGTFYHSYYSGVHILFPGFQRLRLEYGIHKDKGNSINFGFTMGFYEKSTVQRWIVR